MELGMMDYQVRAHETSASYEEPIAKITDPIALKDPESAAEVMESISVLLRLDHIALTHGHLDHARSAGLLARRSKAKLHCSEAMMQNASVRRAPRRQHLPPGYHRGIHRTIAEV